MDEISINQNLYDFLLFSYFGITVDSDADEVISACIRRAYRDAASHVLTVKDEIVTDKQLLDTAGIESTAKDRSLKTVLKEIGVKKIRTFIGELSCKTKESYDTKHGELCKDLVGLYKDHCNNERCFTCGVAQKWVNMSVKYLWLFSLLPDGLDKNLHIPLDSYIIKIAKADSEKMSHGLKISESKTIDCAWSKISDYDKYKEYQDTIREKIDESYASPLDWECPAWIEASKAYK